MEAFSQLAKQIPDLEKLFWVASGGIKVIYDVPQFIEWREKVKYELRKMKQDEFISGLFSDFDQMNGYTDERLFHSISAKCNLISQNMENYINSLEASTNEKTSNIVFIVHGHDNEAKTVVARTLELLGLEVRILHEQPDNGNTIIEKIEDATENAAYAIVLYTECDVGRAKEKNETENRYRARQNVVFEHGFFMGCLGRERVCALVKGDVEKPSDLDGIVYTSMDEAGAWKMQICKNMKAVGIDVDVAKII